MSDTSDHARISVVGADGTVYAFILSEIMDALSLQSARHNGLRLVMPDRGPSILEADARRAVAEANQQAASMGTPERATEASQVLALRVSEALEGGRAAILRAPNRRKLVDLAGQMGMRPFEANLVIAIVQDGARRGETPTDFGTRRTLAMVPMCQTQRTGSMSKVQLLRPMVAAVALACIMLTALITWVGG